MQMVDPAAPRPPPAKPFLKWCGGKSKLLPTLVPMLPADYRQRRHVEPFLGGGAMFFHLRPERALLADANADLILTYRAVQGSVETVIDRLRDLSALSRDHETYLRVRAQWNKPGSSMSLPEAAAMFIYLNKTCFNGLWRVNKRGEFNVPCGFHPSTATKKMILDVEALRAASAAMHSKTHGDVDIVAQNFEELRVFEDDFVYLDPPYDPITATGFTKYGKDGFDKEDQKLLADCMRTLSCPFMLSNSDTPFIRDLYKGFNITTISAPRAIAASGGSRGKVSEVVVRNY
jgi:DNA adenine methylase